MPRYFICSAIGFIILLTADLALAQSDLGTWITRAPIPTPRQEMPHVAVDGKIYVIGGINADRISDETVEVYDPQTDTWTTATSLPPSLHHLGASVVDNKIYVLGGYISGFTPTNRVFAYDPEANEWSEKTAMPTARGAVVAATIDDKIYVIGGEALGTALTSNQVYDPATDTWETRAPMPTAREHLAVATLDDKIYVIGGRFRQNGRLENLRTVEVYDPATDTWDESPANLPQTSGGLAAASLNGRIYAFGGEFFEDGESGVYDMNVEYNPDTNLWRSLAPMPVPRHGIGAVAIADTIFIIAGGPVAGFATTDLNSGFIPPKAETTSIDLPRGQKTRGSLSSYPNPFSNQAGINFSIPSTGYVRLQIVDLHGRVIQDLLNTTLPAGEHSVVWSPHQNASGLYFVKLFNGHAVSILPVVKR